MMVSPVFVIVFIGIQLSTAAIVDEVTCPEKCDCLHETRDSQPHLVVKCYIPDLDSVKLAPLASFTEPFSLEIYCNSGVAIEIDSDRFSSFKMMQELSLTSCKIKYIHRNAFAGLGRLISIKIRSASNFHLSIHDSALVGIPQLETFEMTGCGLLQLPSLCSLPNLRGLNVSNNSLSSLKETGLVCGYNALAQLFMIDISNNRFKTLTEFKIYGDSFQQLTNFKASDNLISLLQNDTIFDQFKHLRIVDLSNNNITDLPKNLLTKNTIMEDLDISHNSVNSVESDMFSFSPHWLQLSLGYNALDDTIWSALESIDNLLFLDLGGNFVVNINQTTLQDLTNLIHLDISKNRIFSIPVNAFQNLQNLRHLYLDGNQIHTVDNGAFYGLLSLSTLKLDHNRIYSMNDNLLTTVKSLTYLNMSSNFLQELPSLKKQPDLISLDAGNNRLSELPDDLFLAQRNVKDINLSKNLISKLPEYLFEPCESLVNLDLSDNKIEFVHPSLFMGLKVEKLTLQENLIETIGNTFASTPQLKELNLSNNQIRDTINSYMFPENLVMIDLSNNNIQHIRSKAFYRLNQIRMIDLRHNQISSLTEAALSVSTNAYAQTGFLIDENPLVCDCDLLWLKKWDQSTRGPFIVNINNTRCSGALDYPTAPVLSIPEERFLCYYESKCPPSCRCCGFSSGCDCKSVCPAECDCYSSEDFYSVHYVRCYERNLTAVEKFLPQMATRMDLSGNNLEKIPSHSFIGISNLTVLFLNNSNVQMIENRSFIGLVSLKRLYLNNNLIKSLFKEMFAGLSAIRELYLHHNYISVIQAGVFDQMHSLTKLYLSNNYLQHMDDYLSHLVFSIPHLTMFSNPWTCDCILYFSAKENIVAYVNASDSVTKTSTASISCNVPNLQDHVKSIHLHKYGDICEGKRGDFIPEELIRIDYNTTVKPVSVSVSEAGSDASIVKNTAYPTWNFKLAIPVMVGATLIIILFISVMCRKDFVKCWLFTKYRCKTSDIELLYDKARCYDAFVSYHQRDDTFVLRELAMRLERGKHDYRLLVHHRDCPPRSSVTQFIESAVKSSHRTIIVLSSDFVLESPWLKFVVNCVKEDSIRRLIVITTGKIDKSKLDPVLRTYLQSDKHIRYGERWFWDKLFYCLPEPGKTERSIARAEAHPYASTDLARFSSAVRDNQAYEEPATTLKTLTSMSSRPLPSVTEYMPGSSQSYGYNGGSQQSSNIYEEIKDQEHTYVEAGDARYDEPWKDIALPVDQDSPLPEPVRV